MIIAATDGKLVFVNEAAERLHGVKTLDVAPDHYSDTYHLFTMDGEVYPFSELPLARAVERGETVEDARWRIRRPDGSEIVAIGSARPLTEGGRQIGAILSLRDDSERFEAERRVRESEAQLRLALDSAASAFYSVDREGNTTLVSRGFLDLMGFERECEVVGQKLHPIIHHSHPDGSHYPVEQCPIYRCASLGVAAHVPEEVFFRLDGTAVPVEYWVSPIMRDGVHVGAICTILDLAERHGGGRSAARERGPLPQYGGPCPGDDVGHRPGRHCTYLNRSWYEFTGQTRDGRTWLRVARRGPPRRSRLVGRRLSSKSNADARALPRRISPAP